MFSSVFHGAGACGVAKAIYKQLFFPLGTVLLVLIIIIIIIIILIIINMLYHRLYGKILHCGGQIGMSMCNHRKERRERENGRLLNA